MLPLKIVKFTHRRVTPGVYDYNVVTQHFDIYFDVLLTVDVRVTRPLRSKEVSKTSGKKTAAAYESGKELKRGILNK